MVESEGDANAAELENESVRSRLDVENSLSRGFGLETRGIGEELGSRESGRRRSQY